MIQRWALLSFFHCVSFTKLTVFVTTDVPVWLTAAFSPMPPYRTHEWPIHRGIPHLARIAVVPWELRHRGQKQAGPTTSHTFYLEEWNRSFPLYVSIRSPTDDPQTVSSYGPFPILVPPDYYFRPIFLELWTS